MGIQEVEHFKPTLIQSRRQAPWLWFLRSLFDFQFLTMKWFLARELRSLSGSVLDVGSGRSPWREFIPESCGYQALDIAPLTLETKVYDGKTLPYPNQSQDAVLCTEVIEHLPDPKILLAEIARVLKPEGKLVLTVPFSARRHLLPGDYHRWTKEGLQELLKKNFKDIQIQERGTDLSVIANKLIVLEFKYLRQPWNWLLGIVLLPPTLLIWILAHLSLRLQPSGSLDPLGYAVVAKRGP